MIHAVQMQTAKSRHSWFVSQELMDAIRAGTLAEKFPALQPVLAGVPVQVSPMLPYEGEQYIPTKDRPKPTPGAAHYPPRHDNVSDPLMQAVSRRANQNTFRDDDIPF